MHINRILALVFILKLFSLAVKVHWEELGTFRIIGMNDTTNQIMIHWDIQKCREVLCLNHRMKNTKYSVSN